MQHIASKCSHIFFYLQGLRAKSTDGKLIIFFLIFQFERNVNYDANFFFFFFFLYISLQTFYSGNAHFLYAEKSLILATNNNNNIFLIC